MIVKTSELTGAALDWAVAMAENWAGADFEVKPYCTDWAQGGPIIERKGISAVKQDPPASNWWAFAKQQQPHDGFGPTPLIAAMRCHVVSELGDEIDVPDDLV